jgi:hypothetical protein
VCEDLLRHHAGDFVSHDDIVRVSGAGRMKKRLCEVLRSLVIVPPFGSGGFRPGCEEDCRARHLCEDNVTSSNHRETVTGLIKSRLNY